MRLIKGLGITHFWNNLQESHMPVNLENLMSAGPVQIYPTIYAKEEVLAIVRLRTF